MESNEHSNKRKAGSANTDRNVSLKMAKVGSGNTHNPQSPIYHRINEIREVMEAPIPSSIPLSSSEDHTKRRMEELHKLITAPPTAEELRQREHGSSLKSHKSDSIITPFSKEIVRRGPRNNPAVGYRTTKNVIARSAETLIKKKKVDKFEDAVSMAKDKFEIKKKARTEKSKDYREFAANNPEEAGKRNQRVPSNLPRKVYIPTRAHQLRFQGKVKDFDEGFKNS